MLDILRDVLEGTALVGFTIMAAAVVVAFVVGLWRMMRNF